MTFHSSLLRWLTPKPAPILLTPLDAARARTEAAQAEYDDAVRRGDTRAQKPTLAALRQAVCFQMRLEVGR